MPAGTCDRKALGTIWSTTSQSTHKRSEGSAASHSACLPRPLLKGHTSPQSFQFHPYRTYTTTQFPRRQHILGCAWHRRPQDRLSASLHTLAHTAAKCIAAKPTCPARGPQVSTTAGGVDRDLAGTRLFGSSNAFTGIEAANKRPQLA